MDPENMHSYKDYLLPTLLYVSTFIAVYGCNKGLVLLRFPVLKRRIVTSFFVLCFFSLLFISRTIWLAYIQSDMDKNFILYAVETLWWMALGYYLVNSLDYFIWHGALTQDGKPLVPKILSDLCNGLVYAAVFIAILYFVYERSITGLIATSGVFAIILGYSAQSTLAHVFSGLALSINPSFAKGDYVEINGEWGHVIDMNWRYVTVEDWQENHIIIPNSLVAGAKIKNFNKPTPQRAIVVYVAVPYAIAPERVCQALVSATKDSTYVLDTYGSPWAALWEFTDYAARYQVYFYTTFPYDFRVKREVHAAIWYRFQREGIPIAVQKSDVTLHRPPVRKKKKYVASALELIRSVEIFDVLHADELEELAERARRLRYGPPERVMVQHAVGDSLIIVEKGLLDIFIQKEKGVPLKVAQVGAGSVIGEWALLTGEVRTATVRAASDCVLYEIDKRSIEPILLRRPELMGELSALLALRLAEASERTSENETRLRSERKEVEGVAVRLKAGMLKFFSVEE